MAYFKSKIDKQIIHGYHDEERATHSDGVHHKEFLENRARLEAVVDEYITAMSVIQGQPEVHEQGEANSNMVNVPGTLV